MSKTQAFLEPEGGLKSAFIQAALNTKTAASLASEGASKEPTTFWGNLPNLLAFEAGSFALSMSTVNLARKRVLGIEAGTFSLVMSDVGLVPPNVTRMVFEAGAFSIVPQDVTFVRKRTMALEPGAFALTMQDVNLVPPTQATFSRVQSATGQADTGTASATFGSTPTAGNLLVAFSFSRSSGASASINGEDVAVGNTTTDGWTKRVEVTANLATGTLRRGLAVWTKVAGASEPTLVQTGWSPASTNRVLVQEFSAGISATWTFRAAASNDNAADPDGRPMSTGTTANVQAGAQLVIGIAGWREQDLEPTNITWDIA